MKTGDFVVTIDLRLTYRAESVIDGDMAAQIANDQLCRQVLPTIEESDFYWTSQTVEVHDPDCDCFDDPAQVEARCRCQEAVAS